MTQAEEIFERIAVALERQAAAQEEIAGYLDRLTDSPDLESALFFNLRTDEEEAQPDAEDED